MSTSLHSERERYGLMIVMNEDELEVEQKSEGKYEVTVEAVEELIPELDELIAEVELVEVDMKGLVVKEVVSGHGDVEGLVVVVGCVLLWLEADNHIHNQTIELHRRFRCLSMYGDLKTIRLSPYFDIRYRFELGFQFNRFEVNKQHIADVMPVLLKSGQSASREEAVEEMKDCRSTVHPYHRSTVMPEYGQAYFMTD
uniref:Uncharacterized protein n=1 Tax=Brassica campestris TaxID=3711 RepID=M4F797_BRACM|nr:unnamed protein product [Brassica rapa]